MFSKAKKYHRIREIVQGVYTQYVIEEGNIYGFENIDTELLAEECTVIIYKLLKMEDMTSHQIAQIAIEATKTNRSWHIIY